MGRSYYKRRQYISNWSLKPVVSPILVYRLIQVPTPVSKSASPLSGNVLQSWVSNLGLCSWGLTSKPSMTRPDEWQQFSSLHLVKKRNGDISSFSTFTKAPCSHWWICMDTPATTYRPNKTYQVKTIHNAGTLNVLEKCWPVNLNNCDNIQQCPWGNSSKVLRLCSNLEQ